MPERVTQQLEKITWRSGVPGAGDDYFDCALKIFVARSRYQVISAKRSPVASLLQLLLLLLT